MEFKIFISFVATLFSFIGYFPYVIDIFKNKTKPHAFTWFTTTITAFIAYGLQVVGGAGIGALPMFAISCICVLVFVLSLWRGTKDITISDFVFLLLSIGALIIWIFAEQPVLSVLMITFAEILAFIPTIRKSWKNPYTETLSLYVISTFRHGISIFALEKLNLLTALYPASWAVTTIVISSILIIRRKQLFTLAA